MPRGAAGHANIEKQKADIADKVASALMMIDRDFVVTYVNDSTRAFAEAARGRVR